ncbi:MMPL family transporter [Kineococcus rhizosphaerae]|uniref:RND superfamily putative drug exporter n=1 Tax=Kineococcus rhizosphaerae TaxID=559628 RepID=A0A2T0QZB2_9ACTN|nr:MMPL family transporter [Kineococcus rhizosphaerae]PRY11860.1 RND superfamily putative drug exporter [Kineococcus rhizosphaerae]
MRILTGRLTAWLVLLAALVLTGVVNVVSGEAPAGGATATGGPPTTSESVRAAALAAGLPDDGEGTLLVVYSRDGKLTPQDLRAASALGTPVPSQDGEAAFVAVTVPVDGPREELAQRVTDVRARAAQDLPAGLSAQVTGGPAFSVDIADSFSGANTRLLLVTAAVVALLLLVTYRSPVLWLVPLVVVGIADQVTTRLLELVGRLTDTPVDPSATGITSVLVFGAGTDYALLLIARYREELRREPDRRPAMRAALKGAGPAIAASATTVVLALLTLQAADLPSDRTIGRDAAIGIVVALVFGLLVLPSALVVCGRRLFWPFVPTVGSKDTTRTGVWARIAGAVLARPVRVVAGSVVLLALLGAGLSGAKLGLSQTEQFRVSADSVDGSRTLSEHFPGVAAEPAQILVTGDVDAAKSAAEGVRGVTAVTVGRSAGGTTELLARLSADPGTAQSRATVQALRAALPAGALVGGTEAQALDVRTATVRDLRVVTPLVVLVVFVVLVVLLRSLVAPVLLVATVLATYLAALGAANLVFTRFAGMPALDTQVPLLSLLFLVALGVDYNIFLVTRVREETPGLGTREAVRVAVAVTGGVITSAGILLAAVFAVLGVLPLIVLTQIGVVVGIGVLLDTLLVRTVLVPALFALLGHRVWWPSRLDAPGGQHRQTRLTASTSDVPSAR